MLILRKAGLVFLSNPKTASQAIRAMLRAHAETPVAAQGKPHMNAATYARRWSSRIAADLGRAPETVAVMRDPLERMQSWFRYRQRDALRGQPNSTLGLTFAQFVEGLLADTPPPYAAIGRQDRFLGFIDGGPPVVHVFDYARLDLLVAFLEDRLGTALQLDQLNVSPVPDPVAALPKGLSARYQRAHRTEIALYDLVAEKGHLATR